MPNNTDSIAPPQPLATSEPWLFLGISRASWNRMRALGRTPMPIRLVDGKLSWRVKDLMAWLEKQPPFKGRTKRGNPNLKAKEATQAG
jgi:hypothetical protein